MHLLLATTYDLVTRCMRTRLYGTYPEASRFMLSFEKEREVFFLQKLMEADTGTDKHYKIKSFTLSCKYVNIMTVSSLDKELHL